MPKHHRLLTLEDLYAHYSSLKRNTHFSAQDDKETIVVNVRGNLKFAKDTNKDTEGLCPVHLQSCHTLTNVNGSHISENVMNDALPSFSNRPILAYIYKDDNGEYQFRDHTMHLDENGELVYDEVPVGIVPESCNAYLEYDEEKGKTYVNVDGYIFEEYSKAYEILEREGECNVSVELTIRELSFDAKEKVLVIENFFFSGVTILGKWEDGSPVLPGMQGSNIKIAEFKQKNNATFSQDNVMKMLEEINAKIDQLSIRNSQGKEETQVNKELFESLLAKYQKTAEDVTFEYSELNDEELEKAFAEAFAEQTSTENSENGDDNSAAATSEGEGNGENTDGTADNAEGSASETFSKTFELSHSDIRTALYALLAPFEETDNEWYSITAVYDDHFVYQGWYKESNLYDQKYTRNGDNVSFDGDRVHMNAEYLTDNELVALNEMRSKYAQFEEVSAKLAKYESEPDKMEIFKNSDYDNIAEVEAFVELQKTENHFDLTVDEVKAKCDEILLDYAKHTKFSANSKTDVNEKSASVTTMPVLGVGKKTNGVVGRYGSTFDD